MLRRGLDIFEAAGLPRPRGMSPPGWDIDDELAMAMVAVNLEYVASARDLITPVAYGATTDMSGLKGVPLLHPTPVFGGDLVHVPSNFSATNPLERAVELVEAGGLLSIKAHIVKYAFGHVMLDGIDALYRNYLHLLLCELEDRYGDRLWFATMAELAERAATRCKCHFGRRSGVVDGARHRDQSQCRGGGVPVRSQREFGQWGDRDAYRWDFEREVGARPADLMVLRDHGQILAGSAVSYRTVSLGDDRILIGIMTGRGRFRKPADVGRSRK